MVLYLSRSHAPLSTVDARSGQMAAVSGCIESACRLLFQAVWEGSQADSLQFGPKRRLMLLVHFGSLGPAATVCTAQHQPRGIEVRAQDICLQYTTHSLYSSISTSRYWSVSSGYMAAMHDTQWALRHVMCSTTAMYIRIWESTTAFVPNISVLVATACDSKTH